MLRGLLIILSCLLAFVLVTCASLYLYFQYVFTYWRKRGVSYVTPSFPSGNVLSFFRRKQNLGNSLVELHDHFRRRNERFGGIYVSFMPVLLVVDAELVKNILVKDFKYFIDRGMYINEEIDPLSEHLVALRGQKWRNLRAKMNPTFSSKKLKRMFSIMEAVAEKLLEVLDEKVGKSEPINTREVMIRYTADVVATCTFGVECNSLQEENNVFYKMGVRIFALHNLSDCMRRIGLFAFPWIMNLFRIPFAPKEVNEFFTSTITEIVEYRERNNIQHDDFINLLLQLKNKGKLDEDEDEKNLSSDSSNDPTTLTLNEIIAHCLVLFIAGFDTSATTVTFTFYQLAKNPSIQERLREEIMNTLKSNNGKLNFDSIKKMTYMQMVISETLRMYPLSPVLTRVCTEDYKIPGSSYTIEEGQTIFIALPGLHWDPKYFPEPEKFDPERFSEENKVSMPFGSYVPFGEGPRMCIGKQFGITQMSLALITVLKKYKILVNPKTIEPLIIDPDSVNLTRPKNDIFLDLVEI